MATIGNIDITNISLGNNEVSSISLGEIEVYSTGPTSPWRFVGLDDNLERVSGTSVTCYGLYKYRGSDTDIEIPSEFNELPVRTIEPEVFKDNDFIESVVIPDSIYELRESCFENAIVEDITFGDNIDYVGDYAFKGCPNLENVILPDNSMTIGREAFRNCTGLQQAYLGNVGSLYDDYIFYNATGEIIFGAGSTVTQITYYQFYNFKGTKVVLPNSITNINSGAFYGCSNLVSLSVPFVGNSRKTASQTYRYPLGAIFGTSSFQGASATKQTYRSSTSSTTSSTYYIPDSLREVIITDSTFISYGSFYNCIYLTDIVLPDNLERIESWAFYYCSNLENLVLNNSITTIDSSVFDAGSRNPITLNVYYKGTVENWCNISFGSSTANPMGFGGLTTRNLFYILDENGNVEYKNNHYSILYKLTIPSSKTTLNASTFYGFNCLASVTLPNTLTSIGSYAFQGCNNLVEVINYSSLTIAKNTSNGYVGYYSLDITTDPNYTSKVSLDNELFIKYTSDSTNLTYLIRCIKNMPLNIVIPDSEYDVIYTRAFYALNKLLSITIGTGITTINEYAFANCSSITSVSIANDIKTLPQYSFYQCNSLTTVTGGSAIETIGPSAFYQCYFLETFPAIDSLKTIGNNAFGYCSNLESIYLGNSLTSLGQYFISRSRAEIIWGDNLSLTSIPNYAFNYYYGESIVIPSNITSIGNAWEVETDAPTYSKVYYNGTIEDWCRINFTSTSATPMKLSTNFYLLDENGSIEYQNKHYTRITNLVIPNTVTAINRAQFKYFTQNLATITIPNTVTTIGDSAFFHSNATIIWDENMTITAIGDNSFYEYQKTSITLPDSLTTIGNGAFYNSNLTSLPTTPNLTTIGYSAFFGCKGLTSVRLPNSVTSLGYSAFNGCSNITSAILSTSLTQLNYYTFYNCSSLVDIVIPASITALGNNTSYPVFDGCEALENVYYKGTSADWFNITINNGSGKNSPMYYASNFYILDPNGSIEYDNEHYSVLTEVIIPSGTTTIKPYQFYGFSQLEELTIPDTVTSIGKYCVGKCSCEIIWDGTPTLTSTGSSSFAEYAGTSFNIPDSITSISDYTFYKANNLTSLVLPSGVTYIGQGAFQECTSLTSINIPNSVTQIKFYAFQDCSSLTSIVVPDSVTLINNDAFKNCSSLTSAVISNSVTSLPTGLFSGCGSLVSITLPFVGGKAYIEATDNNQYPFGYIFGTSSYTGGKYTRQAYITTRSSGTVNQNYYVYIPSSLRNVTITGGSQIQFGAFTNCTMLTNITLPNTITFLGNNAFLSCEDLTSLIIPDTVTEIGLYAFKYCYDLTSLTLPSNITQLQKHTCYQCSSLTSITIPEGVTIIGEEAFRGCTKLETVNLPSTLTTIDSMAFTNCSNLVNMTIPDSLTTFGASALSSCSKLPSIKIPNSVISIGNYAFSSCTGSIIWGDNPSITEITSYMFSSYAGTTVSIPSTITTINNYAFQYSNITYLSIPTTVTTITSSNAFYESSLARIDLQTTDTTVTYLDAVYGASSAPKIGVHAELLDKVLIDLGWDQNRVECLDIVYPTAIAFTNKSSYTCDQFTLATTLTPAYANTNIDVTYSIVSGSEYITLTDDIISINEGVENQTIRVRAVTGLNNSVSCEMDINITYAEASWSPDLTYAGTWVDSGTTVSGYTVYKSSGSYHVNNGYDTARITINGYETFRLFVRSYAESGCDYVVVNNLDCAFSTSSNIKVTTANTQSSSTYTEVIFDNIDGGEHFINITYRKDSSVDSNDDRGYFYIPDQA